MVNFTKKTMWISFFIYSVLTELLPGSNNILALNSTMAIGYKRSKFLLWGIYAGFTSVIFLSAIFTEMLSGSWSEIFNYLRYLGAAYLVYLAWSVVKSKPLHVNNLSEEHLVSNHKSDFWKGFFLQFVNVKIIIYGITAFSSFVLPNYQSILIIICFSLFLSFIGSFATFIWAITGQQLNTFLNKHFLLVNRVMAILLIYCAISLFF